MKDENPHFTPMDWRNTSAERVIERVEEAKIVGMGGAGYPTHLKLRTAIDATTHIVIANGVETDPDVTADRTLLADYGVDVLEGIQIVAHVLNTTSCYLAVDEGILANELRNCSKHNIRISVVAPSYQIGEERVLIKALTSKVIPANSYPARHGIVVLNVATLYAICRCVRDGVLPTQRIVTVLGRDEWHRIGTPIDSIVPDIRGIRVGSSATGHVACSTNVLEATHNAISRDHSTDSLACIRCGKCSDACPKDLPVERMYDEAISTALRSVSLLDLNACNDCGACVVACPSRIHLLDHIRQSRSRCTSMAIRDANAARARRRHQTKAKRLQDRARRDQDERHTRMQQDHQWL